MYAKPVNSVSPNVAVLDDGSIPANFDGSHFTFLHFSAKFFSALSRSMFSFKNNLLLTHNSCARVTIYISTNDIERQTIQQYFCDTASQIPVATAIKSTVQHVFSK